MQKQQQQGEAHRLAVIDSVLLFAGSQTSRWRTVAILEGGSKVGEKRRERGGEVSLSLQGSFVHAPSPPPLCCRVFFTFECKQRREGLTFTGVFKIQPLRQQIKIKQSKHTHTHCNKESVCFYFLWNSRHKTNKKTTTLQINTDRQTTETHFQ